LADFDCFANMLDSFGLDGFSSYVDEVARFGGLGDGRVVLVSYGYVLEATMALAEGFEDASGEDSDRVSEFPGSFGGKRVEADAFHAFNVAEMVDVHGEAYVCISAEDVVADSYHWALC